MNLDIDSVFGDQTIDITCENCNYIFDVPFRELAEDQSIIVCPHCKAKIRITHNDETKKTLKDVNESLKELDKTLNSLGR